jgi:hypothetical protein
MPAASTARAPHEPQRGALRDAPAYATDARHARTMHLLAIPSPLLPLTWRCSPSATGTADAIADGMTKLPTRRAFLCIALLTGCHAHAYYYEPTVPPAPPPAPPPGAPLPAPGDDSVGSSVAPASSSTPAPDARDQTSTSVEKPTQGTTGPLPALPSQAPRHTAATPIEPPSAADWVHTYPGGQWVYHAAYGWIWIPSGTVAAGLDGIPYSYLYTPRFGWTWYVSPWGWGHYHYGSWVTRPARWHHVWVAHPHIVIRLGRPRRVR